MSFGYTGSLDNFLRSDVGPPPSASWSSYASWSGGHKVASNLMAPNVAPSWSYWSAAQYGPHCEAWVKYKTAPDDYAALSVRTTNIGESGADNAYKLAYTVAGSTASFIRRDAGSETAIGSSFSLSLAAGDGFGISAVNDVISAWKSTAGGPWMLVSSVTDSTYNTAGYITVYDATTTPRVSVFGGGTVGGEYKFARRVVFG